jgi:hypothetical protein
MITNHPTTQKPSYQLVLAYWIDRRKSVIEGKLSFIIQKCITFEP